MSKTSQATTRLAAACWRPPLPAGGRRRQKKKAQLGSRNDDVSGSWTSDGRRRQASGRTGKQAATAASGNRSLQAYRQVASEASGSFEKRKSRSRPSARSLARARALQSKRRGRERARGARHTTSPPVCARLRAREEMKRRSHVALAAATAVVAESERYNTRCRRRRRRRRCRRSAASSKSRARANHQAPNLVFYARAHTSRRIKRPSTCSLACAYYQQNALRTSKRVNADAQAQKATREILARKK